MPQTRIGFCPDTAHLAAGGGDPAELIRRYPDRVRHVHLKDVRLATVRSSSRSARATSTSPTSARPSARVGYDGWLVVELDSYDGDPREAARISKTYLEKLLAPEPALTRTTGPQQTSPSRITGSTRETRMHAHDPPTDPDGGDHEQDQADRGGRTGRLDLIAFSGCTRHPRPPPRPTPGVSKQADKALAGDQGQGPQQGAQRRGPLAGLVGRPHRGRDRPRSRP